jgi:hypothetical protein
MLRSSGLGGEVTPIADRFHIVRRMGQEFVTCRPRREEAVTDSNHFNEIAEAKLYEVIPINNCGH